MMHYDTRSALKCKHTRTVYTYKQISLLRTQFQLEPINKIYYIEQFLLISIIFILYTSIKFDYINYLFQVCYDNIMRVMHSS